MNQSPFAILMVAAFVAELIFAAFASVFVRRLLSHESTPVGEQVGSVKKVLTKVRKGEPMAGEEVEYAARVISERRSLMAFSIPAAIFTIGCLYTFGSFDQLHGREPSLRTYIGLLPMLGALNMTVQLLKIGHLKKRLGAVVAVDADDEPVPAADARRG